MSQSSIMFEGNRIGDRSLFLRSVARKARCSGRSFLRRLVILKLKFIVLKKRFNIPKNNEFSLHGKLCFFVVFNLRNSLKFLDLHEGRRRIQESFL